MKLPCPPIAIGLVLLLVSSGALAQVTNMDASGAGDLIDAFQLAAMKWVGPIQQVAAWLLLSLATISLAWKFGLLERQQADFQEFVVELVRMILFVGFFLAVIQYADTWSKALIEGFVWLANRASGVTGIGSSWSPITPAAVLQRGMNLSSDIYDASTGYLSVLPYFILSLAILILYGLIAAFLLLVYCETYFVTAGGVILLGFGGNPWTNDYAMRYITYCISVGVKLFTALLIVGVGEELIYNWALRAGDWGALGNVLSVLGVLMLLVVLVQKLPEILQGVVNGSSIGSGMGSFGAVAGMVGGAAAGAGVAAMGAGKSAITGTTAVMEAAKLAKDQLASGMAGMAGGQPGLGALAAQTAKNLGQAAASVAGDMARGQGGGKLLPEVAKAVHAASVQSGADAALRAASGSPAGPEASPETPPADPMGDHQAELRAMAAEDQREVPPLAEYQAEVQAMSEHTG